MTPQATPAQQGIWFTERAGLAGTAYHMAVVVHVEGALDVEALAGACAAVVRRHPALRQAVGDVDGVPHLVPAASGTLHHVPYVEGWRAAEMARPFTLARGPLIRFTLASATPDRHELLVTAHHLAFDGMSKDILVRELAAGYRDRTTGAGAVESEPLPDPSPGEHARVAAQTPAARAYWAGWPGDDGGLLLPGLTEVPDGAQPGAAVEFDLDQDLVDALDQAARKLTATRFELLLAGVHALLRRYGNAPGPVSVDVSTRTPDTTDHIGLFVNELPVTPDAAPAATFAELTAAVRADLRAAYRYRAVPVAAAVGGMRPRTAMTRVSVSYRRRAAEPSFAGLNTRVEWIQFGGSARNVLHVQVVDGPEWTSVSLQYATAALPAEAVARIGAHLRTVLAAALAEPDTAVADLPVLPAPERAALARRWTARTAAYPADATLPGLFAAQVRATPDAVAATCAGRRMTYAELNAASARLAARLRQRGVGPGDRVVTYLPRSLDLLVAVLAVARAGAAFVPVDRAYPAQRRDLMFADADPTLVLVHGDETGLPADRPVLAVDQDGDDVADTPLPGADPDGLAYVMYTSGSTGRPNGVTVTHRHLAQFLFAMGDAIEHDAASVWFGLTSLSFDPCTVELFLPLITGSRVVIVPDAAVRDPAALVALAGAEGVTHVQATPTRWQMLLDEGFGATTGADGSPRVVALIGGEALTPWLATALLARVRRLYNVYGPTETTVWATVAEISDPADDVTVGRPIANVRTYVVDAALRPVPAGLPGELCIGGPGVTDGYLNRPELTAQRFRTDPFGPPGSRLYRTGDLVRELPDGRLVFLGRRDSQVKIRGHRVELGEIEACLLAHPDVARAAVVLREPADGDARLVAYVVGRGAEPSPSALRDHVAAALPAVMVPAGYVTLPELPMTATGKLDRRALPDPPREALAAVPGGAATPAADTSTALVRQIWQDVLQIDRIGDDEDLFDLGGHSLTITRIMSRIQKRTGVRVPIDAFYDTPTIAEIAALVDAELAGRSQ